MRIYRVETIDGFGPYNNGSRDWMGGFRLTWGSTLYHPEPESDGINHFDCNDRFGFQSLDDLITWFGPYIDSLDNAGYQLSVYEIPTGFVKEGRCQVAFNIHIAELIERRVLTDLPVTCTV